jgi:4a-hydroxytetrahydrobiopterin dehydratase
VRASTTGARLGELTMTLLLEKHCKELPSGSPALSSDAIERFLGEVEGYAFDAGRNSISRRYEFANFYETMAFLNAVAFIANREDHHPDLEVSYKFCRVTYSTHSVGGVSENDFICAAKINALLR